MLETEIEDEEQTNHFFDEGGHWKAEHSPLDLELSESAVYSEEFWLIFETCLTCLPAKQAKIFMMRDFGIIFRRNLPRKSTKHKVTCTRHSIVPAYNFRTAYLINFKGNFMKCRQATRLISDAQERSLMTKEKLGSMCILPSVHIAVNFNEIAAH